MSTLNESYTGTILNCLNKQQLKFAGLGWNELHDLADDILKAFDFLVLCTQLSNRKTRIESQNESTHLRPNFRISELAMR